MASVTKIDPNTNNNIYNKIAELIDKDNIFEDFNRENLLNIYQRLSTTSQRIQLNYRMINDQIDPFFKPELFDMFNLDNAKSEAIHKASDKIKRLLSENFGVHQYIDVQLTEELITMLNNIDSFTIPSNIQGTHRLYRALGIQYPTNMENTQIELSKLADVKFLPFFLHKGKSSEGTFNSLIHLPIEYNIGYLLHPATSNINDDIQSQMINDYIISIIQSVVQIQKVMGYRKAPLYSFQSLAHSSGASYKKGETLDVKILDLVNKLIEFEHLYGNENTDFIAENLFNFETLVEKGIPSDLYFWIRFNWRDLPNDASHRIQFYDYLEKNFYKRHEEFFFLNNPNRFKVFKFCQAIIEIGKFFKIPTRIGSDRQGYPLADPTRNFLSKYGVVLNSIYENNLELINSHFSEQDLSSIFKDLTLFRSTELSILLLINDDNRQESLSIPQMLALEIMKEYCTEVLTFGFTRSYSDFHKELFQTQQSDPSNPNNIFSEQFLNKHEFSGDYWFQTYYWTKHDLIKIYLERSTQSLFQYQLMDELGISQIHTAMGHVAERDTYDWVTTYKNSIHNIVQAVQDMRYDKWFTSTTHFQTQPQFQYSRSNQQNIFIKSNNRYDFRKNFYFDQISYNGLLFWKDCLVPKPSERAGRDGIEYVGHKIYDFASSSYELKMFSEVVVISQSIHMSLITSSRTHHYMIIHHDSQGRSTAHYIDIPRLIDGIPHYTDAGGPPISGFYSRGIPATGITLREFYRDVSMYGNEHLRQYHTPSQQNQMKWSSGTFSFIFDKLTKKALERAIIMAGEKMADDNFYKFDSYKNFLHSLNKESHFYSTASFEERLGLTKDRAKQILIGYGLTWFDEGWNPIIHSYQIGQEYLFDLSAQRWNRIDNTNLNKFSDDVPDQVVVMNFFPIAKNILKHSGMIHLLFDPNELFAENLSDRSQGPLFDKLQNFLDKGLVLEKEGILVWVYLGDLLLDSPIQNDLPAYSYFDIIIFIRLLNGELTFMGWNQQTHILEPVSMYAMLQLPPDFNLENHITAYLNEFPDYNGP